MSDAQVAMTKAVLERIAIYACYPLKRIQAPDTWVVLGMGQEDLTSLALDLEQVATGNPVISADDLTSLTVLGTVKFVLAKAKIPAGPDPEAQNLFTAAMA